MINSVIDSLDASSLPLHCLSIDLEVGVHDSRIHHFAAVRGDNGQSFVFRKGDLPEVLGKLDDFGGDLAFLLGHNLIAFDVPHLVAARPDMRLLKLPMLDTLRLNPLAFPRNPYHHLVKHYQDAQLTIGRLNNPELDARLTLDLLRDQCNAFKSVHNTAPDLLLAWHWLTTMGPSETGFNAFFTTLRNRLCPSDLEAGEAIERLLNDRACVTQGREILGTGKGQGWGLAYTLAWLSVAGGNSVMPPWVCHQFPEAGKMVQLLRDTACDDHGCGWCRERHDAQKELTRWFGFAEFLPEPADEYGRPLQQNIVEAAMQGKHLLGIMPTGAGKSLCYQIPALSRYDKTGALTVVISPLVALMADQIAGLETHGITSCAAINGLLSMPERADALDRVRLGDVGILLVSPEQLRSSALQKALAQREIGAWVLDEVHCLSKWGHDFRPDYRYVGRFIRKKAREGGVPPVLALTATANPDVMRDIMSHFRDKVGVDLMIIDGGATRTNLDFNIVPTTPGAKFANIQEILLANLQTKIEGGAIVYCATRRHTEELAQFLKQKGLTAEHFHAKLKPETKKSVQGDFIRGELRVIVATNAFGMGIDKPNVRLVIHADIPGSLENYMQEAGRAGRDRKAACCVLLYTPDDVERQFGMSARSRLSQREIQSILKSLRRLDRKKRLDGEVVATAGEILAEEADGEFERDSATDDTRVRTAISWLEEAALLSREENRVQIFPSSLHVSSMEEARDKLGKVPMPDAYRGQLLSLVRALMSANADEGISTDELMGMSRLSAAKLRSALHDLERLGIASNDTALTAFVHVGVERSSQKRLQEAEALEVALIDELRQAAPNLGIGDSSVLHLRHATQSLKDLGHAHALPEKLRRIAKSLSNDGHNEEGGMGSLRLRRLDSEAIEVKLQREWPAVTKTAQLRRVAAKCLLEHLLTCLSPGERGTDLLAGTTLGKLFASLEYDLFIKAQAKDLSRLMERALLWLHEQDVIQLNKGLAVFRPAMTIFLEQDRRGFLKADFEPLKMHYEQQIFQIHVMAKYANLGLQDMAAAICLAMDYFHMERDAFIRRWMPDCEKDLARQTTPESWRTIIESLNNPVQQRIVTDDREKTNVLVLAGPGSGKTRVLVHRIAYLVRVKRENVRGILALAYNRHAAVEIRRRLGDLIGDDAKGVTVLTCHALAMRLAGVSFARHVEILEEDAFKKVLEQAVALLKGEGLPMEEADEQRTRLLAGFRWILVDEYQDIGPEQYELISALAGRTSQEEEGRLSLFAVGDDDQNIYAFDGASVEFIRRFESDYDAKPTYLIDNYRSTAHIIAAANLMIHPAKHRMKREHPIGIDRARRKAPSGGDWQGFDRVGQGRVQLLPAGADAITQAVVVMNEFERLSKLSSNWNWANAAVIAREWKFLEPIRCHCEMNRIPAQMADENAVQFWRLRETQMLIEWLRARESNLVDTSAMRNWLNGRPGGPWWALLMEAVEEYGLEASDAELPIDHFIEWLVDWGREVRRRQSGLMLLTAHRAKGLEFDHVAVLDGGWEKAGRDEDSDAPRRLYYVAMTRARKTLTLARFDRAHAMLDSLSKDSSVLHRAPIHLPPPAPELARQYQRLTPKDVDLGFSGRYAPGHAVHRALATLAANDPLQLRQTKGSWELIDDRERTVGRLSQAFKPPKDMTVIEARVVAVINRYREDCEPEYRDHVRCEQWEVVLPELVFAPQ